MYVYWIAILPVINKSCDGTYLLKLEIAGFVHPAPLLHRFPAVWLQNEILQHGKKSTRQLITKHSRKSSAKFKIGKSCRKPRDYVVLISRLLYVCMVPLVFCLIFKPRWEIQWRDLCRVTTSTGRSIWGHRAARYWGRVGTGLFLNRLLSWNIKLKMILAV